MKKTIFVKQPSLPDPNYLIPYLEEIWDKKIVVNNSLHHKQPKDEFCRYFEVPYISLISSGITGLIVALKRPEIKREAITTPYSYIDKAHSLSWNKIKPFFLY